MACPSVAASNQKANWANAKKIPVFPTKTFQHFQQSRAGTGAAQNKNNLGELAIQEAMNEFSLMEPPKIGVFLFEDHKIARASFLLPDNCRKISTRAFLSFLEQKGWIGSAAEIERQAVQAGRTFSRLRFPPT